VTKLLLTKFGLLNEIIKKLKIKKSSVYQFRIGGVVGGQRGVTRRHRLSEMRISLISFS
jgi:hypothetical protein